MVAACGLECTTSGGACFGGRPRCLGMRPPPRNQENEGGWLGGARGEGVLGGGEGEDVLGGAEGDGGGWLGGARGEGVLGGGGGEGEGVLGGAKGKGVLGGSEGDGGGGVLGGGEGGGDGDTVGDGVSGGNARGPVDSVDTMPQMVSADRLGRKQEARHLDWHGHRLAVALVISVEGSGDKGGLGEDGAVHAGE